MDCRDKSVALELMTLKKPTALDELINAVPKPKGAVPNFGLPRWKSMPLESKIPLIPGPEGSYHFTRNKVGKKLWVGSADAEFNLNDPYNHETEWTYEPLHDEHLARFFSQPANIKRMINLGLITKNLDAKCSIKDYNMYRKYLKKLYNDSINLEIRKRVLRDFESRDLFLAEKFAERDVKRLNARKIRMEASGRLLEKIRLEKEAKLARQKEQQLKIEQRLKDIELNKIEARKSRFQKAKEQVEILKKKREAAAYTERQKVVKTIKQWHESEYQRKMARRKREIEEKQRKKQVVEERWQLRQEMQRKQMEREIFLQQCSQEERIMNIKAYNAKVDKEQARMRQLLEKCKMFVKCYINRHIAGHKERNCCFKNKENEKERKTLCADKSVHIRKDKKQLENKKKAAIKKCKKKKGKKKKEQPVFEPETEPEPVELNTVIKIPPSREEPPVVKDNCECEKIKAELLAQMSK